MVSKSTRQSLAETLPALVVGGVFMLGACGDRTPWGHEVPKFATESQAVHLDNGQVVLGKLERSGDDYPVLDNAFAAVSRAAQVIGQADAQPISSPSR